MKRSILCLLSLGMALPHGRCQDKNYIQRPALGVHILFNDFTQRDSLHASGRFTHLKAGIALNYLEGLSPHVDWTATLAGSFLAYPGKDKEDKDKRLLLELDAALRIKLFSGRRWFNPFLQAGTGISKFRRDYGLFIPVGSGFQTNLSEEAFLLFQSQYRIPVSNGEEAHFYYSIGIAGIIGKKKKPAPRKVIVLPSHPPEAMASQKDTDGDGIVDSLDACPFTPGLQSFGGCPDKDDDGIPDKDDKCPDLPGPKENEGCPIVEKNIRRKIEAASKNVFFETDSFTLLPASYKALDEVAGILKRNPLLKLDIEGHTDSTGNSGQNKVLSERRANSVLEYLVTRAGIKRERLSAQGFGSTKPVAGNNTVEGKALNRRVEFKLRY